MKDKLNEINNNLNNLKYLVNQQLESNLKEINLLKDKIKNNEKILQKNKETKR